MRPSSLAGNHEANNDFYQYIQRFNDMPLQPTPAAQEEGAAAATLDVGVADTPVDSMWHSFDLGPVHVVMLSSEVYFWLSAHGACVPPVVGRRRGRECRR